MKVDPDASVAAASGRSLEFSDSGGGCIPWEMNPLPHRQDGKRQRERAVEAILIPILGTLRLPLATDK